MRKRSELSTLFRMSKESQSTRVFRYSFSASLMLKAQLVKMQKHCCLRLIPFAIQISRHLLWRGTEHARRLWMSFLQ